MILKQFDVCDLAQKAGALHLLPDNADYYAELIRISALVASLPDGSQQFPRITDCLWREWINSSTPMQGAPELGGDPAEGPFVVEVAFFGGAYLTLPAANPEDPFILSCLLEAIFHRLTQAKSLFLNEAFNIAIVGLWLSDNVVRSAGLRRNTKPASSDNGDVRWPHSEIARSLECCVRLCAENVAGEIAKVGGRIDGIERLGVSHGGVSLDYSPQANPICRRPFIVDNDQIVVVSPSTLVPAVRDALLELAEAHDLTQRVSDAYHDAVHSRVRASAELQQWQHIGTRDVSTSACRFRESVFQIDADKAAAVYTVCDDLRKNSGRPPHNWWDAKPIVSELLLRCVAVEKDLLAANDSHHEILHVLAIQGLGRGYILAIPRTATWLTLTADELAVFSLLNLNDPLALWQVALAKNRIAANTSVIGGGFLDHYALFRKRGESYYFGDEGIPDMATFAATGLEVRHEAQQRLDPHCVWLPHKGRFGPVMRLQNRLNFPIYAPAENHGEGIELLVEGLPIPLWVVAPLNRDDVGKSNSAIQYHLADAISFWAWQLTPSLLGFFERSSSLPKEVTLFVKTGETDDWLTADGPLPSSPGISISRIDGTSLLFEFSSCFARLAMTPENSAERELARLLVSNLLSLLDVKEPPAEIDKIVDRHAPLGPKRRFTITRAPVVATIDTHGLPSFRRVQPYEESKLADEVGSYVRKSLRAEPGPLPVEQRQMACHSAVEYLFAHLRSLVNHLSPEALVKQLIERHERLIADRRQLEITMASHLACFGDTDAERSALQRDFVEVDKASIASRFLIEHVGSCPPLKGRGLSTSSYDELLATASEIVHFGHLSDSLHYGISDHDIALLRSGRLALADESYDSAMTSFQDAFYRRMAGNSSSVFLSAFSDGAKRDKPDDFEQFEQITAAEFGLSMSKLFEFLGEIASSPNTSPNGVGVCERELLVEQLASITEITPGLASSTLAQFCLCERDEFLSPPPPFAKPDVFPWRFNRGLSYLRRPIVVRQVNGVAQCIWGRRAILQASNYLLNLCIGAQLKNPHSKEMTSYQGRVAKRIGERFNDLVAREVMKLPSFVERCRIKKFNGKRLERPNGETLGDIDVLAVAPESQLVFAIEAKSFSLAKTPAELANERDELFGRVTGKAGALERHLERTAWIRENIRDVLKETAQAER
jgi:hypothetical protein